MQEGPVGREMLGRREIFRWAGVAVRSEQAIIDVHDCVLADSALDFGKK